MVYVELDNPGEGGDYMEIIRGIGIHVRAINSAFLMQLAGDDDLPTSPWGMSDRDG
jgi:hypothetical protein